MKYACIDRCRERYSVYLMCRLLGVSRSGYYAAKKRPESRRSRQDRELLDEIKRVHARSKGVYGSPKITAELADEGLQVGRNKVAKLMRLEGLRGCPRRRYRVTTQQNRVIKSRKTSSNKTSQPVNPISDGLQISRTYQRTKVGCISPLLSTCTQEK